MTRTEDFLNRFKAEGGRVLWETRGAVGSEGHGPVYGLVGVGGAMTLLHDYGENGFGLYREIEGTGIDAGLRLALGEGGGR